MLSLYINNIALSIIKQFMISFLRETLLNKSHANENKILSKKNKKKSIYILKHKNTLKINFEKK